MCRKILKLLTSLGGFSFRKRGRMWYRAHDPVTSSAGIAPVDLQQQASEDAPSAYRHQNDTPLECQERASGDSVVSGPCALYTVLNCDNSAVRCETGLSQHRQLNKITALFCCCFDDCRMLAYKISACEVCTICLKPTAACKMA